MDRFITQPPSLNFMFRTAHLLATELKVVADHDISSAIGQHINLEQMFMNLGLTDSHPMDASP